MRKDFIKSIFLKNKILLFFYCLIELIFVSSEVAIAYVLQKVIDLINNYSVNNLLIVIILAISSIFIFFISSYITSLLKAKIIQKFKDNLYDDIYNKTINSSFDSLNSNNNSFYISLVVNDVSSLVENYLKSILSFLGAVFLFILSIVYLIYISAIIAILIFLTSVVISLFPLLCSKRLQQKKQKHISSQEIFTDKITDFFQFISLIKIYKIYDYEKKNLMKKTTNMNTCEAKFKISSELIKIITIALSYLAQITVFIVGAILAVNNMIKISSLVASIQVSGYVVSTITTIIVSFEMIIASKPVRERINCFFKDEDRTKSNCIIDNYDIKISNLYFKYENKIIFNNFTINISYGKKVLVLGESGCGKTTLLKILLGINTKFDGSIKYGNIDIRDINDSLYDFCLLVPQENMIFHDTIKNNILLGASIDLNELNKIIEFTELSDLVKNCENGIDTMIKDNGKNISGGERQKIGLARALIRKPKILFLDESFSAIDKDSTITIKDKLFDLPITIIEVSHHNYELSKYDFIIDLNKID